MARPAGPHKYMSSLHTGHQHGTPHTGAFTAFPLFFGFLSPLELPRNEDLPRVGYPLPVHCSEQLIRAGLCSEGAWGKCSEINSRG